MLILGIETSCDDTAMAVIEATGGMKRPQFRILSNMVSGQIKIHAPYGGVVPNLAARAHTENFVPVLRKTLRIASSSLFTSHSSLLKRIDLIAVTNTPGLVPALLIGVNGARALAWAMKKPILGINHLEGHVYANFLPQKIGVNSKSQIPRPKEARLAQRSWAANPKFFPAICLLVSGGHTQLVLMRDHLKFKIIGETRDDAAGEAFDKVAKMLGLPFPGGPPIAACAAKRKALPVRQAGQSPARPAGGAKRTITLPRPMIDSQDYDFSFSGLKTAVLYLVRDTFMKKGRLAISDRHRAALCAEFQQAVIDVLIAKTMQAAKRYRARTMILGGGVAANAELRRQLDEAIQQLNPTPYALFPNPSLAVDNGAMIAAAAYFRWLGGERGTWKTVRVKA